MSQNNPANWTNNEWKFSYEIPEQESGLPGQLSPVGDRQQGPLDMLGSFGEALFTGIFDTLGNIFNGIVEVGGSLVGGLIGGIKDLVGWVGSTIASLLSGGTPRVPPPPIYSEIRTDLEGDLKPFVDAFKESQEKAFQAVADAKALRELFDENQQIVSDRIDEADNKIQQVGDVDAKIAAEAGRILAEVETHRLATEVALGKAETASEDLAAYKLAADAKIQSALADAKAGLDKLEALEPRVSGVISDLEAYELAVNAQIQDLLGVAGGAVSDAERALENYDTLLADYEPFKTDAAEKLEALNTLTDQQQETINGAVTGSVIEYAVGSSETSAPTTGWSTATPKRTPGSFVWMRTKVTYGSGTTTTTSPALVTGNTGSQGPDGKGGVSVTSIISYYLLVNKGSAAPVKPTASTPSGWSQTEPAFVSGRELYRVERVAYSDGTFSYSAVSKVSSYAAAEEVQKNLDQLHIGGRNFLLNSASPGDVQGHASGMQVIPILGLTVIVATTQAGNNQVSFGSASSTPSSPERLLLIENRFGDGQGEISSIIPSGDDVVMSFDIMNYAYEEMAPNPAMPDFYFSSSTGYLPMVGEVKTNEWTRVHVKAKWPGDGSWSPHVRFLDQIGAWYLKNFKLETGTVPTEWSPASEESIGRMDELTEGLENAATQEDYNQLNTRLWGSQGELNKLNDTLWDSQGRMNSANELFKTNIKGWQKDVYEAFQAYDGVNQAQDGLIAANNKIASANTAALRSHQDILDMAFPNTNLVPTTDGVPVWTTIAASNPIRTEEGVWRFNSKTAVLPSSSTKHVPTLDGVVYRATVRLRRTTAETQFSIRIRKAGTMSNASLSEVTDQTPLPGAKRKNFPTATHQITSPLGEWETWYHDFKLANGTGDVRVGYVLAAWGIEVDQLSIVALLPSQHEVNALNREINSAQNEILHDHQRVLDLMNPPETVVAMYPGGLNIGTDTKPEYIEFPYWVRDSGSYLTYGAGSLPDGNRVAVRKTTTTTPTINGHYVPVTPGGEYRYEFFFKATAANSGLVIYMTDDKGAAAFQSAIPDNPSYGNNTTHLWWSSKMPGGTGPDGNGFYRITGKLKVRDNVTRARISRIYYNWSSGSVTTQQTITGLRIWPDVPSQQQVDAAQNEASESNKKAIDALERAVRLSFPHINTLPYSGGNPLWQSRASWITRTTTAANLPPASQRTETFSSLINGDGTMVRNAASSVTIPDDVSELRIRGLLRSNGGFFPTVDLHNDAGASIISAWRRTFPTDDEVTQNRNFEVWYNASSAGGYPVDGNNLDPWQPFDIVVRVKPGSKNFHIKLSSASLIAIHGLAVFSYYPSQSEVDFAQDRAMRALSDSVDLAASIGTAATTAAKNLGIAQTAMQMSLVTTASYIPRVMIVKDLGSRSAHERSEHVQVRKDGTSTFLIDARGSSWTGLIVVTVFYGSNMATTTFEITPGGSRTNGVPKRLSNEDAKHIRIDYWVNPEVETKEVSLGGTDVPHNKWVELAGTSFTATGFVPDEGPALPVLHIAELAVGWDRATNHAKYGVRIKLAGIVVATLEETRVGPRYPWGEPYASQVISWSGQVMPNQKITFEVLSNDTVPSQRRLRDAKRLVSYTKGA